LGGGNKLEMNRSKRRAAIASGRDTLGAAAVAIPELLAVANRAYQERRLADAEVICKQILSPAPSHATCLNLLGVVYQASARHRLAIKLFTKAIAVDDLDAGFHYNIACSYQATGEQIVAAEHFKMAITLGMSEKRSVEEFIMENVVLLRCIDRIASRSWSSEKESLLTAEDVTAIAQDILLRCALELTIIHGGPLELLLTSLRSALGSLAANNAPGTAQVGDDVVHLFCALAQQCFINEYVFAQTENETKRAGALRDCLVEKLVAGGDISPSLLAAVAAYFPLYSIPNAKSLLALKWPEYAVQLLRQQVREPLEELEDRPKIPTLTAIDDLTSKAVMQQYDENPYPRWTINPCKVVAGDMKRHARTIGSSEPRPNQDILIAGCGTGKHPFWLAHYFPHARILAIDLSRANLAYARRRTREEVLQNIEYAQADILKLGAIGRTFDRIDAVGVLHHLADPKAGWRVLLSLLAPTGIMRVGVYSEAARRDVVQARALIAERGYGPTIEGIRALRQKTIRDQRWEMVLNSGDFYSASGCRDLLFNVMEHRFTIPEIASFLKEQGLVFHGFELDGAVIEKFQHRYPGSEALTNLEYWNAFEADNPKTFRGMYVFTVSKTGRFPIN
jgi:2-polyprenyl-3-methyl-5-hydroxy-6-metoxy-1,4-benzoquinol methylase